jgi:hypothetical protein
MQEARMLDLVTAVRFDRRMTTGKSWPCLLSCLRSSGEEVEVVAKFSSACDRGVGGLVAEALAAMLAADLGLPVPEPLLVEFDTEFVALIRARDLELAERIGRSVPVAFGSRKLPPGFTVLPKDKAIPQHLRAQAAEIFAFNLERFQGAWRAVSDSRLQEYLAALPAEWGQDGGIARDAARYIGQIRENIEPALAELTRVLR